MIMMLHASMQKEVRCFVGLMIDSVQVGNEADGYRNMIERL